MSQLPYEDVDQVWRQMGTKKDWSSFMKTVMNLCGKTSRMDVLTVDYLVREANDFKNSHIMFPESAEGLEQVLAQRMFE